MLKMLKLLPGVRLVKAVRMGRPAAAPAPERADLQIRNLLDDPGLRRVMGLDRPDRAPTSAPTIELPLEVDHVTRPLDVDQVSPPVELVTHQSEALADLRQVVRNAAA